MRVGKLYYILWEDATSSDRWKTLDELREWIDGGVGLIDQVGWVIEKNKDHIVLCSQKSNNIEPSVTGQHMMIPRAWIKEFKQL